MCVHQVRKVCCTQLNAGGSSGLKHFSFFFFLNKLTWTYKTGTPRQCNIPVSVAAAVSCNTQDQSPACTAFCSLACSVRPACWHSVIGLACSFDLHMKPIAVMSVPASHSRYTSQWSINILQFYKTYMSAHPKDDLVTMV